MPITTSKSAALPRDLWDGVHQPGDTYKCALIKAGHVGTFNGATDNYSDLGSDEVPSGGGYTTGGATLSGRAVVADAGTEILDFDDPSWAAATIDADGALIYNATRAGKVLGVFAFGVQPTSSTNGTFTVQFPAPTAAAGLLRMT